MRLRQKAVQGVLWSGIQQWASSLITMIVIMILTRMLTKADFGLVALAMLLVEFLGVFQRQGLTQALIQREVLEDQHLDSAFWSSTALGSVLAVAIFLGADVFARVVGEAELGDVLRWLSVVVFIESVGMTAQAILRREMAFRRLAWRPLCGGGLGGVVGVGMALSGYGVWSLVGQQIAASASGVAAVWLASGWYPRLTVSRRHLGELLGFGVFTLGREVVNFVNRRIDELLIGAFLGKESLGVYRVGRQLVITINRLFTQTLSSVTLPTFSRLQHDHGQARQALLTATGMCSLLVFPAFMGAAVLAPELVFALFGAAWSESVPIMRILALGGLVQYTIFFNNPVIVACGKPSWVFAASIVNAAVGLVLYWLALPFGVVAISAARALRSYVCAPIPVVLIRRLIGIEIRAYVAAYSSPVVSALIMVGVIGMIKFSLSARLGVHLLLGLAIVIGVTVYVGALRLLAPQRFEQAWANLRLAVGSDEARA